jgi:hypothetical protein
LTFDPGIPGSITVILMTIIRDGGPKIETKKAGPLVSEAIRNDVDEERARKQAQRASNISAISAVKDRINGRSQRRSQVHTLPIPEAGP